MMPDIFKVLADGHDSGGALVDERGNVVGVVSAKLNARAAFLSSGALPENVNYAVKGRADAAASP